jgi:CheY-like chemotaxis protein
VLALDRAAGACGSVRSQLSPLGFRIECCADSRRLMDTLSPEMHDIVVVNTTEPGGEGLAMVGRIRSNPRFGRIPIVLVTSSAPVSGQSDMLRQMGVPLVTRPCSTADLVGCLEQAVTQGLSQAVVSCKEAVS